MYRIVELKRENKVVNTELDMVCGERSTSISVMSIKFTFKKSYKNYLEAIAGLDNIKRKGIFTIIKENK